MATLEELFTPTRVIYIGRRVAASGKLAECYITEAKIATLEPPYFMEQLREATSVFEPSKKRPHLDPAVIGGVYEMECRVDEDGIITTARTGSRKFLERSDHPLTAGWEVADRAASADLRRRALAKKAKDEPALDREMAKLREAYQRTSFADRMAFELMVLNALRRGL